MRTIGIFLSSSLKHNAERRAFIDAFEAENTEEVTFKVYGHEINGDTSCVPGKDSQLAIDAEALTADVFVCYMGDMVGNATIWELEQVLADRTRMRYVYPIIQPGLKVEFPADMADHYTTREKFEKERLEACGFYSTTLPALDDDHTTLSNIRAKVRNIAETLRNKTIVELTPKMLAYDKIIPNSQQSYRLGSKLGYYRRELDDQLDRELSGGTPVTMVWGTSLAGKTRAVTEALGALDKETHVHVLKEAGKASVDALAAMSAIRQFSPKMRNVFFIDEIDRYLEIPACRDRILDACRMAAENPERVQVVATSMKPKGKLEELLMADQTADEWFDAVTYIEARTMSREEARALMRKLLRSGIELKQKIADDMPIGALLIDLSRMHNVYEASLKKIDDIDLVYDAIKSLWLWKNNSRGDSKELADYICHAYDDADDFTPGAIYDMMKQQPELFMLDGRRRNYTFDVDELLVQKVFRFEESKTQEKAIERMVDYIVAHDPLKFESLTKLLTRLVARAGEESTDKAMAYALKKLDLNAIASAPHETETSKSGDVIDWTARFIANIADRYARQGLTEEVRRIYEAVPVHSVLGALISAERAEGRNGALLHTLGPDGMPLPEYAASTELTLHVELVRGLEFDQALAHFRGMDFEGLVNSNTSGEVADLSGHDFVLEHNLQLAVWTPGRLLMERCLGVEQIEAVMAALTDVNRRLGGALFASEGELTFRFIGFHSWYILGRRLDKHEVTRLFERLLAVDYDAKKIDAKGAILSALMPAMDLQDCRWAWARLGELQDSFALSALIQSCTDFADAYGAVSEFQRSAHGSKVKLNSIVLNRLLKKCESQNDVNDCEQVFRRAGLLGEDERIGDMDDAYTFGTFLNLDTKVIPEKSKRTQILKRRPADGAPTRSVTTLKVICRAISDYAELKAELYGPAPKFWNREEQQIIQDNAEANSYLFRNAVTPEQTADALRLFDEMKRERKFMITESDHIISELLKRKEFFRTFEETSEFFAALKREFPELARNGRNECQVVERLLVMPYDREKRIDILNSRVVENSDLGKEPLERLLRARFFANMRQPYAKMRINDWTTGAAYPLIGPDGRITVVQATRAEFCDNMLRHELIHEEVLTHYLSYAARQDDLRLFDDIVEFARLHRIYLDNVKFGHREYIKVRLALRDPKSGAAIKLLDIAPRYSVAQEVIDLLYNAIRNKEMRDTYSVEDAIKTIEDHEAMTGRKVYRSSALMAAMAKRLQKEPGLRLGDVIERLKELAPEGYRPDYIARQALLGMVKSPDDLKAFYAYTPEPIMRHEFSGLLGAVREVHHESRRRDLVEHALALIECQEKKPGADVIMGFLYQHPDYDVERSLEYFAAHGLEVTAEVAGYLFGQVRNGHDYRLAREAYTGPLMDTHLSMLFSAMYNRFDNLIIPQVFNRFKYPNYTAQWRDYAMADEGTDKLKKSFEAMQRFCKDKRPQLVEEFTRFWGGIVRKD